jgi:hypothetical protein
MVILAAVGTVLSLTSLSLFTRSDEKHLQSTPPAEQGHQITQDEKLPEEATSPAQPATTQANFPRLAQGLYAGSISNLIPDSSSPLALISMPNRRSLVVIIGLPGWTPVEVAIPEEDSTKPNTITVRSNGLIINVTGELADDSITGMFSNAITGESGSWSARIVK